MTLTQGRVTPALAEPAVAARLEEVAGGATPEERRGMRLADAADCAGGGDELWGGGDCEGALGWEVCGEMEPPAVEAGAAGTVEGD